MTDKAIRDGFAHLKDAKAYEPLFYSAYSRSVADWLVGINATRALTCKYNAQLACGRVQTPTLAMIALQEDKIRHFKPQDFYGIQVKTSDIHWTWHGLKNETYLFDEKQIDQIIQDNENQSFQVSDVTKTSKKKYSPQLYDLTELQRDANKIYGYSAKETLSIMQSLYEYHKLLTYPRTDSRYLTDDIVPTLKERLEASLGGNHDQVIQKILSQSIKKQAHFVNNSKVSDHHAIIPTEQTAYLGELNESELKIYELVLKRFLAVLLPPYEYEQTTLTAHLGHETFIAKGKREKVKGWKEVYDMQDDEQLLPIVQVGDKLEIVDIIKTNGQTQPPAYFNEATLLSAMENPVRFMNHSNQKLNQTLIQTGGLGTVATRADIIEKLFNTFLIEKHGQDIHVTHKGRQLLSLVPEDLRSPELTARWELQLSKIAQRKLHSQEFIKEIRQYTVRIIDEIEKSDGQFKHDNMTHKKCPECGEPLLEVNGKKGKMLVCSSRECHYRETLSVITNARCPQCHKKLELVGKGDKQMFVCKTCGYRIGMKAFQKEREERKQTAGKSDVKKYLQKQKKETQMSVDDSPFAALLNLKDQLK